MTELPGVTHAEVIRRIQREIQEMGSKAQAARAWGISIGLLDFILKGQRNIGPKLLTALGLKRTTLIVHRYGPADTTEAVETVRKPPRGTERIAPE